MYTTHTHPIKYAIVQVIPTSSVLTLFTLILSIVCVSVCCIFEVIHHENGSDFYMMSPSPSLPPFQWVRTFSVSVCVCVCARQVFNLKMYMTVIFQYFALFKRIIFNVKRDYWYFEWCFLVPLAFCFFSFLMMLDEWSDGLLLVQPVAWLLFCDKKIFSISFLTSEFVRARLFVSLFCLHHLISSHHPRQVPCHHRLYFATMLHIAIPHWTVHAIAFTTLCENGFKAAKRFSIFNLTPLTNSQVQQRQ